MIRILPLFAAMAIAYSIGVTVVAHSSNTTRSTSHIAARIGAVPTPYEVANLPYKQADVDRSGKLSAGDGQKAFAYWKIHGQETPPAEDCVPSEQYVTPITAYNAQGTPYLVSGRGYAAPDNPNYWSVVNGTKTTLEPCQP